MLFEEKQNKKVSTTLQFIFQTTHDFLRLLLFFLVHLSPSLNCNNDENNRTTYGAMTFHYCD